LRVRMQLNHSKLSVMAEEVGLPVTKNGSVALCHFCEQHGPSVVFHTRLVETSRKLINKNTANNCIACNPLGRDPGFITEISDSNRTTFSSGVSDTDNRLKQACFRSLSSEVSPSKEGPIFFSDSGVDIHVISYTFFLKDSSARGFQRWFSLICLAPESAPLLKLWPSLVVEMKEIIFSLQQMATEVYQREEEHCSHKMLRSNFQNTAAGSSRALQEITGNGSILSILHSKLSHLTLLMSSSAQVPLKRTESWNTEDENLSLLVSICKGIGPVNFRRFMRHILKGGNTSICTDDLLLKENCINALQLLMPLQNDKSFILVQHTLKSVNDPYLLVSPNASTITCIWNGCEVYTKPSCIVSRLEQILFCDCADISVSLISKQLRTTQTQLITAAAKIQLLKDVNQHRVLQFFQSFGYDIGDMDILQHWSTFCC